jgi:hypothetical protein
MPTPKLLLEMAHDLAMQEHAANNQLKHTGLQAELSSMAAPATESGETSAADEAQEPEMVQ